MQEVTRVWHELKFKRAAEVIGHVFCCLNADATVDSPVQMQGWGAQHLAHSALECRNIIVLIRGIQCAPIIGESSVQNTGLREGI